MLIRTLQLNLSVYSLLFTNKSLKCSLCKIKQGKVKLVLHSYIISATLVPEKDAQRPPETRKFTCLYYSKVFRSHQKITIE